MLLIDVPFRRTRWFPRRVFQLVDDIPDLAVARYQISCGIQVPNALVGQVSRHEPLRL